MSHRDLLLLFAGPVLALIAGLLIYASGPVVERSESWRSPRNSGT